MKITIGPLSFDVLQFVRLCLPATVLIVLCVVILLAFNPILLLIDQVNPPSWQGPLLITAWLLLLALYIVLGVLFTRFAARYFRRSVEAEALHDQRRIAIQSGLPFYVCFLLSLLATILCYLYPDRVTGPTTFVSELGIVLFAIASLGYLILLRIFLPTNRQRTA